LLAMPSIVCKLAPIGSRSVGGIRYHFSLPLKFRSNALRYYHHSRANYEQFRNASAIPPSSLPSSKSPRKWTRRLLYVGLFIGTSYVVDTTFNASAITRAFRCVYHLSIIGIDYKLNFKEGRDIDALHNRSADRLYKLLISNRGLYIKMGQAVAVQASMFPPVFQEKFKLLFDMAPQDSWKEMQKLFKQEYGVEADEYFEHINHRAVASASIAQVHRAKLKTGEDVAVKLQHSDLSKQVYFDLQAYKGMMWFFEKFLFNFPIYFVAEHVSNQLSKEVDFLNEIENSERLRKYVEADPSFADKVYIPKIFKELSTKRVIVFEWIDGVSLGNKDELVKQRYNVSQAMNMLIRLYGAQIFQWGHVHCDPHPGNIILRRHKGNQQLVLIDHGLYIEEDPIFRRQYSKLWKAFFQLDFATIGEVASLWGFGNAEMFTRASTVRSSSERRHSPTAKGDQPFEDDSFEAKDMERQQFQDFMKDVTKIPLELIFLGRTMRILQGCNRLFNSPVNRVKILAYSASRALAEEHTTYSAALRAWKDHFVFVLVAGISDVAHWLLWIRSFFVAPSDEDATDMAEFL
jgi:aarF domain-containing kinase